jgi:very-short-patch-repair endonuclease
MKNQTCKHCNQTLSDLSPKVFANHVRWCISEEKGSNKFQLYCSCVICKESVTTQNIKAHYTKHHTEKKPKSVCPNCEKDIFNYNKFCCKKCSSTYTNARKDWSNIKTGPSKGTKPKSYIAYTKVKQCEVCASWFPGSSKTCSPQCKSILLSIGMANRIYSGWNPNDNRGRGKRSYLESSFEQWLITNYPKLKFVIDAPFKRLDVTKTYFGDFFFPDLNLIIELDGSQHDKTKEYDEDRDRYISETYNIKILRVTHKEYQTKSKLDQIVSLLS